MEAVRSKTIEANVVVAHGPVEGQAWWEALGEMLTTFAHDMPTYVCIDANGRLGLSTSKLLAAWQRIKKHPIVSGYVSSLWGLCALNTVICERDGATWVPTRRRPRRN